jgi:ribonuclease VapC
VILDTSAILAILFKEPGFEELLPKLDRAPRRGVGSPTLLEAVMVLSSRPVSQPPVTVLTGFLQQFEVATVPFGESHWQVAAEAFQRFGKGRHPAALNYGDCFSYATARLAGEPLLCVGNDFPQTDLELA